MHSDPGTVVDGSDRPAARERPVDELDAFISYARADTAYVTELTRELQVLGRTPWLDADDIPAGSTWREELVAAIESAIVFVFVISPDSVASEECRRELDHAVEVGKRLIPVRLCVAPTPPALAPIQWIEAETPAQTAAVIDAAIKTDYTWLRDHAHWLGRALQWDRERSASLLPRGDDLRAAERWLARRSEGHEPRPTELQTRFIATGRQRALRRVVLIIALALVVVGALALVALLQRGTALRQRDRAASQALNANAIFQLDRDPQLSLLLARRAHDLHPTPEVFTTMRRALFASRVRMLYHGSPAAISALAVARDGKRVVTAGNDGAARVWEVESGRRLAVFEGGRRAPRSIAISPDGGWVAAGEDDGTVSTWDVATGRRTRTLNGRGSMIASADISNEGALLTGDDDGRVTLWGARAGAPLATFPKLADSVVRAWFGSTQPQAFVATADGKVTIFDTTTTKRIASFDSGHDSLLDLAVRTDDRMLATAGLEGVVRLWRGPDWQLAGELGGHDGPVMGVAFNRARPDVVLTGGWDGTARLWKAGADRREQGQLRVVRTGDDGPVRAIAFSADGASAFSAGDDATMRRWAIGPEVLAELEVGDKDEPPLSTAMSPDGGRVAIVDGDGGVKLWDWRSSRAAIAVSTGWPARRVRFAPAGGAMIITGDDGRACVWDARSLRRGRCLSGHGRQVVVDGAFSHDGRRLATASMDGTARVWDAASGRQLAILSGFEGSLFGAAFSPDGSLVAVAGEKGTAVVWDWRGGRRVLEVGGIFNFTSAAFSPDGRLVAVTGDFGTTEVWDWQARTRLARISGGPVETTTEAEFNPDGDLLVSGSLGTPARVWGWQDTAMLEEVAINPVSWGLDVSFSADGTRIAVGERTGDVRVYACPECGLRDTLPALARTRSVRTFTPAETRRFLQGRG